jgi:thioredoxin-dependent adenylylsulfate APS reductase
MQADEANRLSTEFESATPQDVLEWALGSFGRRIALSAGGGIEGMVLSDMAHRIDPSCRVFTLDTGRLPQETYDLFDKVRARYGIEVEYLFPGAADVEEMIDRHGANLMYESVDLRVLCCNVRKVRPLNRYLATLDGWVTGLRRSQWKTREAIRKVEVDDAHGGIVKVNPLAYWSKQQVWDYAKENDVPHHALLDEGYTSIGCDPCTRAVEPGEDDRAGRWWWEKDTQKECGMHCSVQVILGENKSGQDSMPPEVRPVGRT